jgi:hypothetical protein
MEIIEIISYYVNNSSYTIEVKFRLSEDEESEIRVDEIPLSEADDFGFSLILEDFDFFNDDEENNNIGEFNDVDEDELLSFLNEYYMVYPDKLPSKDLY